MEPSTGILLNSISPSLSSLYVSVFVYTVFPTVQLVLVVLVASNSPLIFTSNSQNGIYTPLIFSMFFSSLKKSGMSGLPLLRLLNDSIAFSFSFLNGIIKSGANFPDSFSFNIAVFPQ